MSFQLAHVSDIHIKWHPGDGGPWYGFLNKRLVGGLNLLLGRHHSEAIFEAACADLRKDPPDHLAVTGDLTNLSLEAEFLRARSLIESAGLPPDRISVIPGNHDTYTAESYRAQRFEQLLAPVIGDGVSWPRSQRAGDVLIVSTTSSVPTPWFTAYGRMGPTQLASLRESLAVDAAFKVVLVHHPPLQENGRPDRYWRSNHDGRALVSLCLDLGVGLILCGHTHKAFSHVVEGGARPLRIECAGSTTKPGATYNRYTIADGALKAVEQRRYDADAGAFTPAATQEVIGLGPPGS